MKISCSVEERNSRNPSNSFPRCKSWNSFVKQCRNCRGSSRRSRVSDGTRPTPYSVSRQNRLVRMHGIVELQKTLHAEHRQAQAIRLIQPSAWIFNAVEASSHFLQQPRSAERLTHAWYFRHLGASGPPGRLPEGLSPPEGKLPRIAPKSLRKNFFRLYIFQRVRTLAGIAGWDGRPPRRLVP